MMEKQLPLS